MRDTDLIDDPLPVRWAPEAQQSAARALVSRGELLERLSAARERRVILVCAPAGSGKTVLIRSWLQATNLEGRSAWVSVARGERDAQRFWLGVVDGLAAVVPVVQRVAPSPAFRGEAVLEQLLRDLAALTEPAVLVIDDLHELRSPDALGWLEKLLAGSPAALQVVLTTREDPRLGLHRLRLAGDLAELRGPDLRFSREEIKQLLREAGVMLSDRALALLDERTEGWAAGLRLAVISLTTHGDPERFVSEFSGSERTVAGYLLAEVLDHQAAEVREMLLRTSVLERVSGPLADFLTGGSGAERILQELEDAGAFVTSLDARRSWFRYHHLFADLLQLELRRTAPASVASLHRAAAHWLAQEGHVVEAIRHAQAARDWPLASRLLADNHLDLTLDGRAGAICDLLRAFPDDVANADAELALVFATARVVAQKLDAGAKYVELARSLADTVAKDRQAAFDALVALLRLVIARWRGDLGTVLEAMPLVEAALAAHPVGVRAQSEDFRGIALQNLGVAELWSSRFADSRRHLEEALALARHADRPWLAIADLGHLAIVGPWTGGSFSEGLRCAEEAVKIADAHGWSEDPALLTALAAGARTLVWLGRFQEAEHWLGRAVPTMQPGGEPASELMVHQTRGLLCLAQGRPEKALGALRDAERMQALLTSKHAFITAVRARLAEAQARMGALADARETLGEATEQERDTAEMRVAQAVLDLAHGAAQAAMDVLAPVLKGVAPTVHRPAVATEAQVLDAAAREQLADGRGAEASLERALELAEPEGIVLPFVLVPVREVLERLRPYRTAHATLRRTILDVLVGSAPAPAGEPPTMLEELSEAELRVVRYLPSNLRAPEIAAELCVSTNTVRTHLRHIYAKLGAHGRAEAVARARQLRLLAPTIHRR